MFLVLQAYLCTRFVSSDQCQLATYHPFYVQAFIPAFYTLSMIDDLSLISLPLGFYVFETCMYLHLLSHGLLYCIVLIKPNLKCFRVLLIFLVVLMMVICSNLLLQIVGHVIMKFNFVFIVNAKCSF